MSSATAIAPRLNLDHTSLGCEQLSMPALMRELNLQKKPSWLLVKLMNSLEQKRQAQGLGWSRAWNKYGLTVFRTHIRRSEVDAVLGAPVVSVLEHCLAAAPAHYRTFVTELLNDPNLMSFTFFHNNTMDDGRQYEGLTLSFGRRVNADRSKRDRLDIILEDERKNGRVDGIVDRIRIYVCPWSMYGKTRAFHLCEYADLAAEEVPMAQDLFRCGVESYHRGKADESQQWSHWSVRYIDYFGPRGFIPEGSSFT